MQEQEEEEEEIEREEGGGLFSKGIMFLTETTRFVCLRVCLSVCVCVSVITFVKRWLDSATLNLVRKLPLTLAKKMQHYQDDPQADPDHIDHLYKMTFWPITSKLINGFTPNFTCI